MRIKLETSKVKFTKTKTDIEMIKVKTKKTKKKLENEIADLKSKLSEIEEKIKDILRSAAITEIHDEEIIKLKEDLIYYREQLNIKVHLSFKISYFPQDANHAYEVKE